MSEFNTVFYSLAVGSSVTYHQEAQLSIVSLYAYSGDDTQIVLYTDQPKYYRWMTSDRIDIRQISQETLDNWIKGGPNGGEPYFFRAKLCLAAQMVRENNCATLWYDTDCVAVQPISLLTEKMAAGTALMQKSEDRFSDGDTKAERAYWKALKDTAYAGIQADEESRQWNSGIMGLPAGQSARAERMLQVLDAMMAAKIPGRTLEQVAAGLTLENTGPLEACDEQIMHYWANKEVWHGFALELMFTALNAGADLDAVAEHFRGVVDAGELPPLRAPRPSRLERHKRRWRKRLRLLAPCEK